MEKMPFLELHKNSGIFIQQKHLDNVDTPQKISAFLTNKIKIIPFWTFINVHFEKVKPKYLQKNFSKFQELFLNLISLKFRVSCFVKWLFRVLEFVLYFEQMSICCFLFLTIFYSYELPWNGVVSYLICIVFPLLEIEFGYTIY